uniref:Vomeronasal type-1 receptor n=1 Tax=Microcebus murinus TaxID=30608 RepID=A0A1P8NU97_MICMU|nr:vomeronasal 1 receptor VN1R-Mmur049 [Microcebus murinus]APX52161.1 vomeronasal 1 receptor VN1R-Mmur049 [Microcebus murinus]
MVVNIKRAIFLFLTTLGAVGNVSVFMNYMCIFFWDTEKKSLHFILIHLAFTNIIILFSKGIPMTMAAFGIRNFLGDTGCKIVVYMEVVARGLSICTSSLLTVVQAITISPRASMLGRLKPRSPWNILPLFLFFWTLNSLISMNLLYSITNTRMNISQISEDNEYCYFLPGIPVIRWIFLTLMALRDTLLQGLMSWSSAYMVFLLHKHHKNVLYIQSSKFLCKTHPEIRAAKSILFLMLCFVFFYWADYCISSYLTLLLENNFIILNIREFLAIGYAVLSPFVLIFRDRHMAKWWHRQ